MSHLISFCVKSSTPSNLFSRYSGTTPSRQKVTTSCMDYKTAIEEDKICRLAAL